MSFINKVLAMFGFTLPEDPMEPHQPSHTELPDSKSEIEKLLEKFNNSNDILVVSEDYLKEQSREDIIEVECLGNRVIKFKNNTLVNVAIIKTGVST